MHHFRIATYEVTKGTPAEIGDLAKDGMLPIFQQQPGFQAYSVIETGPKAITSLSVWASHAEAENAVSEAADWVADNIADRAKLTNNTVGDALFWVGAAD